MLRLGPELAHLSAGDIVHVPGDGRRVTVLWKNSARHNGLLLTEQCDNYCLMCSQPPKDRDDSWLFHRARKVISLLPGGARALSLTGGEPTLHADALIGLLEHCKRVAPGLSLHLLSNGRRFADPEFTRRYAAVGLADIMVGIPVYAPEPGLHDFIVQAAGAFDETVHGILNLASLGQAVEIRVVVQRHTVPVLAGIATFIARNLPFVAQVALMGLEMTGLARPNSPWSGPTPPTTSASWPRRSTYSRPPGSRPGSTTTSSASSTGVYGRTRSARSATGRTITWTSAALAQSATHAAAFSPQAATASASTCARCLSLRPCRMSP